MIKTIITPKSTNLNLLIPKDYVGKELEVLLYKTEEISLREQREEVKSTSLRGLLQLSEEQSKDFHQHAINIRNEW